MHHYKRGCYNTKHYFPCTAIFGKRQPTNGRVGKMQDRLTDRESPALDRWRSAENMVVFFLAVRILGEGSAIHSPPVWECVWVCVGVCVCVCVCLSGDQFAHNNSTLYARIGTPWLSEQRRLRTSCMWARFPDRFPHYVWTAWSTYSDFVGSRVYACLSVTCYWHFWQNDRGLLCATEVTWRGTDTE